MEVSHEEKWRRHGFHTAPRLSPEEQRALWAYVYLKHQCTNYEQLCEELRYRRCATFAYPAILHRINRAVLDRFPKCLTQVKGLALSPEFQCRRCGKPGRGVHNGHYWEKPRDWLYRLSQNEHTIQVYCRWECSRPDRTGPED